MLKKELVKRLKKAEENIALRDAIIGSQQEENIRMMNSIDHQIIDAVAEAEAKLSERVKEYRRLVIERDTDRMIINNLRDINGVLMNERFGFIEDY